MTLHVLCHAPLTVGLARRSHDAPSMNASIAWAWLRKVAARITSTRTIGLAAEMAFWLFLSLIPLAAVAGLLAARLALRDWSLVAALTAALPPDVTLLLENELVRIVASDGGAVPPLAALFFVWLASSGVHSIFDAFEASTGTSRPWWMKRLLAILACIGLSVGGALVALVGGAFESITRVFSHRGGEATSAIGWIVRTIVAIALLYGIVAMLFRMGIPRAQRERIRLVPGTIIVVVLHMLLAVGYRTYIATAGNGGAYLAGLAVIGVTMMTVYLFSLSILIGLAVSCELSPAVPDGASRDPETARRAWLDATARRTAAHRGS